jgi:type VI secretion system protein ImpF
MGKGTIMPPSSPQLGFQPSLIDRLIDPQSAGTAWRQGYGVAEMVETVRRDLEDLLNTRQSHQGLPEDFVETHQSIVGYGLPDLTAITALTPQQREEIGRLLEAVVTCFEPRLRDVRAHLVEPGDGKAATLRFRIDARLCVEPAPDVAFETILELTTGHSAVKQAG